MMGRISKKEQLLDRENLETVLLQQAVVKELKKIADDGKQALHAVLADGEKRVVLNERGAELGSIYRTSSKPAAKIVDINVVAAQADEQGEEIIYRLPALGTPEYERVVDLVLSHDPDLAVVEIAPDGVKAMSEKVLADWEVTGNVPDGWEIVDGKAGYTATRLSAVGKRVVAHLMEGNAKLLEEATLKELS